jgi:magnesium chelatase family protein
MGFAQLLSRAQVGLAAPVVRVEVHLGAGLPGFSMVGLAAPVVRESKERVRAALAHCGYEFPAGRITVNLAPADLPKEGGRFDLAVALGILLASGQLRASVDLERCEIYGELGLAGELKPVPGLLLAALHGAAAGRRLLVPSGNAKEARLAMAGNGDLAVAADLAQAVATLQGTGPVSSAGGDDGVAPAAASWPDLADVRGQHQAKRALLIAAAGGHSLLLVGSPGAGKSMLAQRLPGLLPPLSRDEALEVAAIDAIAQQRPGVTRWAQRPFRAPHHTASAHAIVGGGRDARPGEVSLAHRGVLFLDELPEFDRRVLEALREPLETGVVSISRANLRADYPADFQFIAAMNPCPCGYQGDPSGRCRCGEREVARYRGRLSGPLLDRIDLHVSLRRVETGTLLPGRGSAPEPASTVLAEQVAVARQRQHCRQGRLNARLAPAELTRHVAADAAALALLARAGEALSLSARACHRVMKVARSIADLEGNAEVGAAQLGEALALRTPAGPSSPGG